MKSDGSFFPQVLISKLSEMGILMLIPSILALIAVQRHTAASRSRSPCRTEQHGWSGGFPISAPIDPLSNFVQTPSFRASLGQLLVDGVGFGLGFGSGLGWPQVLQPLTSVKKRMLTERKRAVDIDLLDSISPLH